MFLRICFALHKDIEISSCKNASRQEAFKDVLSLFSKILLHFAFIKAIVTFHWPLYIA